MLSLVSLKEPDLTGLFSSILSSISWFIFGLTWPAVATTDMFVTVGWLWYAVGVIFALLAFYMGLRMMGQIFGVKTRRLVLQDTEKEEEE